MPLSSLSVCRVCVVCALCSEGAVLALAAARCAAAARWPLRALWCCARETVRTDVQGGRTPSRRLPHDTPLSSYLSSEHTIFHAFHDKIV